MKVWRFDGVYLPAGWLCPAYVFVDGQGMIQKIEKTSAAKVDENVPGYALPGFHNAHSHAFQYAMAGMAEYFLPNAAANNFWSWRQTMYGLAEKLSPEQIEIIATALYVDMLKNGYTSVAEFHYLHHQSNGERYADPTEISRRLINAAQMAGIHLALIPVYYQTGDFNQAAASEQRRFTFRDADEYLRLIEGLEPLAGSNVVIGHGVHSLRAAPLDAIQRIHRENGGDKPFHIHIAEQIKEVESCLAATGRRPVEYLFDKLEVGSHWHLIHSTHINEEEMNSIVRAQTNVVLCPTTEANLGDGLFPLQKFHQAGGRWTIGSDSHVSRDPLEELRWLDYGQRLTLRQRTPLCGPQSLDSGEQLLKTAVVNGQDAVGQSNIPFFSQGSGLNAVVFTGSEPPFITLPTENWLSALIFAHSQCRKLGTIRQGSWSVQQGRHPLDEKISNSFHLTLRGLFG